MRKSILFPLFLLGVLLPLSGCNAKSDKKVLRVLNCEDYIYLQEDEEDEPDLMDQWVEYMNDTYGEKVSYIYDTFDTNETMFNELKTGKVHYDIVIPSDYMIQKMMSENMLENFNEDVYNADTIYGKENYIKEYISPYLKDIFEGITAKCDKEELSINKFSVPYMWGTVGLIYNPEYKNYKNAGLTKEQVIKDYNSWDVMYGEDKYEPYKDSIFIKDSIRDTYVPSIIHVYHDELFGYKKDLENKVITEDEYNQKLTEVFNRADDKTLELVEKDLMKLKEASFGFEVDSGKTDITVGKVGGDLAWSGDAVWSMDDAEHSDVYLYYSIPEIGSNIWFDAMCMPKGANVDLATKFMNFISMPSSAVQNMDYIGYTPGVAGDEMLEYVYNAYDVRGEVGGDSGEPYEKYNLSYFFDGTIKNDEDAVLHVTHESTQRQLRAQFPEESQLPYLAVMKDFGDQNEAVLKMWENVRTNSLPTWAIVLFVLEILFALSIGVFFIIVKQKKHQFRKGRKALRLK